MTIYDAFVSYSHAKDKPIAAALQSAVQRLGKPWHRRRALRLFRDDTSLSATPQLWPSIETALVQSRYLILLASPNAAASPWVAKEVSYWLDHKSADTLLIALTDGALDWDNNASDFVWRDGGPLPSILAGRFQTEPKWVDLRAYRGGASTGDARFTELAADFAATIRGLPKEDLLSQEIRQQRRALTLAWGAIGALVILAGSTAWQWSAAIQSERIAAAEAARAERNFLAAKDTIDAVIFDLTEGLRDVEGMRAETAQRILSRAEATVAVLIARTENDPALRLSQAAMFGLFSDTYARLGATARAADYAERAIAIMRPLRLRYPDDARIAARTSTTLGRVGATLVAQGDLTNALRAYREALAISRTRTTGDPENRELQHGITIQLNNLGDVLATKGDLSEALSAYRESLQSVQTLSALEPGNRLWRRSMSATLMKLGDLLRVLNDLKGALDAYRESLAIARTLAAADRDNTQSQQDLHFALVKVGQTLFARDDFAAALPVAREGLDVARALAAKDKSNMQWLRGVMASLDGLGKILEVQGDIDGALAAHRESLAIRRSMAAMDTRNTEWQRDVSVGLNNIGDMARMQGDFAAAIAAYREALDVMRALPNVDENNKWQIDIVYSLIRLGAVGDDSRERFAEALAMLNLLHAAGQLPPMATDWIVMMERNLARVKNRDGAVAAAQAPIAGDYEGTNTNNRIPGAHRISLTFQQVGAEVNATYRSAFGDHGHGSGTISDHATGTIAMHSNDESCPGSHTASFWFSADSVKWIYAGSDCVGPVRGRGTAARLKQ